MEDPISNFKEALKALMDNSKLVGKEGINDINSMPNITAPFLETNRGSAELLAELISYQRKILNFAKATHPSLEKLNKYADCLFMGSLYPVLKAYQDLLYRLLNSTDWPTFCQKMTEYAALLRTSHYNVIVYGSELTKIGHEILFKNNNDLFKMKYDPEICKPYQFMVKISLLVEQILLEEEKKAAQVTNTITMTDSLTPTIPTDLRTRMEKLIHMFKLTYEFLNKEKCQHELVSLTQLHPNLPLLLSGEGSFQVTRCFNVKANTQSELQFAKLFVTTNALVLSTSGKKKQISVFLPYKDFKAIVDKEEDGEVSFMLLYRVHNSQKRETITLLMALNYLLELQEITSTKITWCGLEQMSRRDD